MTIFVGNGSLLSVPHEFVERLGICVLWIHFVKELACKIDDVEEVIDHDNVLLSMLRVHMIIVLALRVVVVLAFLSGLPNPVEDELAFLQCYLAALELYIRLLWFSGSVALGRGQSWHQTASHF